LQALSLQLLLTSECTAVTNDPYLYSMLIASKNTALLGTFMPWTRVASTNAVNGCLSCWTPCAVYVLFGLDQKAVSSWKKICATAQWKWSGSNSFKWPPKHTNCLRSSFIVVQPSYGHGPPFLFLLHFHGILINLWNKVGLLGREINSPQGLYLRRTAQHRQNKDMP
jgi:hypothetical protein